MFSSGGSLEPLLAELNIPHVRVDSVRQNQQIGVETLVADSVRIDRAVTEHSLDAIVTYPSWPFPIAQAAVGDRIPVLINIMSPAYAVPGTPQTIAMIRQAAQDGRVLGSVYDDCVPHAQAFGFDMKDVLLKNLPMDDASARNTRNREDVRAELGLQADEIMIFSACRLDADRFPFMQPMALGVDELRRSGRKVQLFVAGDGTHAEQLRATAPSSTTYLGVRRDMPNLYAAADIFCGEGSTVMEASRAGLPAIMSCALTQASLAQYAYAIFGLHVVDMFYWQSTNVVPPTPFADALALLVDNAELRQKIGQNGKQIIIEDWNVGKYMTWLMEVIAKRSPESQKVTYADFIVEISGGGNEDVRQTAAALFSTRGNNIGVISREPIPWDVYTSLPIEHAKALTRASRRIMTSAMPRYVAVGRTLTGSPTDVSRSFFTNYAMEMDPR
ncbi:MAG: hypothetical protein M3126_04045 [Candidatus Eremiobacteraeota bacterium]|nr:hypothetical protein [Candidatus Eremiobacteraeota bacterium]